MIRNPAHKASTAGQVQTLGDYLKRREDVEKQLDLDLDSDEPLPVCPVRGDDEQPCESCQ